MRGRGRGKGRGSERSSGSGSGRGSGRGSGKTNRAQFRRATWKRRQMCTDIVVLKSTTDTDIKRALDGQSIDQVVRVQRRVV